VLPGEPDELPAILFLEASRQAALIAAAELHGFAPGRTLLTRWGASFRGFAEPGLPLFCTVRGAGADGAGADGAQAGAARDAAGRPRAELRLAFLQGEREVADVSVSVLQDC
jgi:hypothetical protein